MPNKAPDFDIKLGGASISPILRANLISIDLQESITDTAKLTIIINEHNPFQLTKEQLKLGTDVKLKLGYTGDLVELFDGEVFQVRSVFKKDKSELEITCLDRSYILKRVPVPHLYEADTFPNLLAIAKFILKKYDLKLIISPVEKLLDYKLTDDQSIEQAKDTDWKMLSILSTTANQKIFCRGRTVYIVDDAYLASELSSARFILNQIPTDEQLSRGLQLPLLEFNPRVGGKGQREAVKIIKWDSFKANPKFESTTNEVDKEGGEGYTDIKIRSTTIETLHFENIILQPGDDAQAKALVKSEMQRRADSLVLGEGSIIGNPRIRYGDRHDIIVQQLGNIGFQFTGTYIVTETMHTYNVSSGYSTGFKVRRPSLSK